MDDIAADMRRYVDENFLFGIPTDYADDDSFLENSIVDSTGVLELIGHIEATYGIKVRDEDLVPENLDSINAVAQFICRKREAATTA